MTAICASHYRNPLNDYVGKKHHHQNRFRQRQSSRSAFYRPGLRVLDSHNSTSDTDSSSSSITITSDTDSSSTTSDTDSSSTSICCEETTTTTKQQQEQQSQSQSQHDSPPPPSQQEQQNQQKQQNQTPSGHWGFRPSALQHEEYGRGTMSVSEIVDWYVLDNERAEQEGVLIPPRPSRTARGASSSFLSSFSLSSSLSTTSTSSSSTSTTSSSILRCLQWNIQAFSSPKDERNLHTITAGIIRSICETDSDVLVLNEIHWREMEDRNTNNTNNTTNTTTTTNTIDNRTQQARTIRSFQTLLEEVLRLRGYHFSRVARHGDTPTMIATRHKVLCFKELVLSPNRSALCLLLETHDQSRCWVVGTHLDAFDAEGRRSEIHNLLQKANTSTNDNNTSNDNSTNDSSNDNTNSVPILIQGDFNQQRCKDYTPSEWKRVAASADLRGVPFDDGVAAILEQGGFRCVLDDVRTTMETDTDTDMDSDTDIDTDSDSDSDSASISANVNANANDNANAQNVSCNWNKTQPPPSTHWSGTTIDYTYYSNQTRTGETASTTTNNNNNNTAGASDSATTTTPNTSTASTSTTIAPHGVYVGPAGFSDHRMTVTDWTLTTTTPSRVHSDRDGPPPKHIDKSFFFHHLPAGRHHSWLYNNHNTNTKGSLPQRRTTTTIIPTQGSTMGSTEQQQQQQQQHAEAA